MFNELKLFVHDGHDTQISNIIKFFNSTNVSHLEPSYYGAQFAIELLYSETCLEETSSEDCLAVKVMLDATVLEFAGACEKPGLCSYPEFLALLDSKWYGGLGFNDWDTAC